MVLNIRLLKSLLFFGLGSLPMLDAAEALQTYPLVDHHQTSLQIAVESPTRLAVLEDRIAQIFGADGVLEIDSDDEHGQLFLRPLDPTRTKPLKVTIVTEKGLTQDLKLIPHSGQGESILFKPAPEIRDPAPPPISDHHEAPMALMEKMVSHVKTATKVPGHKARSLPVLDRPFPESLTAEPLFIYKDGAYTGRVFRIRNDTKAPLTLDESAFAQTGDVAIAFLSKTLAPKQATRIFIISNREETP